VVLLGLICPVGELLRYRVSREISVAESQSELGQKENAYFFRNGTLSNYLLLNAPLAERMKQM
jgi:hypothetical protein